MDTTRAVLAQSLDLVFEKINKEPKESKFVEVNGKMNINSFAY